MVFKHGQIAPGRDRPGAICPCCETDEQGQCLQVNTCYGDDRTGKDDNCLSEAEGRAWSSPIFIDYAEPEQSM